MFHNFIQMYIIFKIREKNKRKRMNRKERKKEEEMVYEFTDLFCAYKLIIS